MPDTEELPNLRNIVQTQVAVTTVGTAGSAQGSAVTPSSLNGYLAEISVNYHASAPASTVLVITDTTTGRVILTLDATATDVTLYPRVQVHDEEGAAITGAYDKIPLYGSLTVTVTASNALTNAVVVTLKWEHSFV